MGSGLIEVSDIGLEDVGKLLLVQDDYVIEALSAHAPPEAFTAAIGSQMARTKPWELSDEV